METAYIYDNQGIYTHSVDFDPYDPIPARSLLVAPPTLTGTQVARRVGYTAWEVLPERPALPEPAPAPAPTLEEVRAAKVAEILAGSTACAAVLKARYSELEVDSWSEQRAQAETVLAGGTLAEDDLLPVLAMANGFEDV